MARISFGPDNLPNALAFEIELAEPTIKTSTLYGGCSRCGFCKPENYMSGDNEDRELAAERLIAKHDRTNPNCSSELTFG